MGAALGDTTVRRTLRGARARGPRRFPANIRRWVNLAAEDDYISHDQRIADDYAAMLEGGLCEEILDHRVYNLALRDGRSNPHHGVGYLVHPVFADTLAAWLASADHPPETQP
jgi:hypothetical protein